MIPAKLLTYLRNPWVLLAIAVLVIAIMVYAKKWNPFDFFKQTPDSTDVVMDDAQRSEARAMAKALYDEMSGVNYMRDFEPWRRFMQMSAFMQQGTYQEFSNLYADERKGTLTRWVTDESDLFPSWNDPQGIASRSQILERLQTLGLS